MSEKPLPERVASIEVYTSETRDDVREIKGMLVAYEGRLRDVESWRDTQKGKSQVTWPMFITVLGLVVKEAWVFISGAGR